MHNNPNCQNTQNSYIKNFLKQTSPNSLTPIRPEWDAQAKTWPNEVEKYHRGTIVMKAINEDNHGSSSKIFENSKSRKRFRPKQWD